MEGKKFDQSKCRLELVPPSLMFSVGWILTRGAEKYGDRNWEAGLKWSRPYGAIMRHLLAWWNGETFDRESGSNHLHHAACELAFLIEYAQTHPELDNRPSNAPDADKSPFGPFEPGITLDPLGIGFPENPPTCQGGKRDK